MNRTTRIIFITGASLTTLFVMLVLVVYISAQRYLSSDEFREMLSQKTSEYLEVEVEFAPLQWSGFSVYSSQLAQKAPSDGSIASLQADQIRAQINFRALIGRKLHIQEIEVKSLKIEFQVPKKDIVKKIQKEAQEKATSSPGILAMFAPKEHEISQVILENGTFRWPAGASSVGEANGVSLTADSTGVDWNVHATQGRLLLPELPKLQIQTFKGRVKSSSKNLFITDSSLRPQGGGNVDVSGEIGFGDAADSRLDIDMKGVSASELLTGDWKLRVKGELNAKLKYEQSASTLGERRITGPLQMVNGKLEAFPILDLVAEKTKTQDFRSLKLDTATCQVSWTPTKLDIKDINVESKSLLKITGDVTRDMQKVEGLMHVGTTESTLQYIPGARQKVFVEQRDIYLSTPVQISGTPENWEEDLTPRLKAAFIGAAIEGAQEAVKGGVKGLIDFGRSLLNDSGSAIPNPLAP